MRTLIFIVIILICGCDLTERELARANEFKEMAASAQIKITACDKELKALGVLLASADGESAIIIADSIGRIRRERSQFIWVRDTFNRKAQQIKSRG